MPLDLQSIKGAIELSVEELVRVADTKITWNHFYTGNDTIKRGFLYLPGVYTWEADKSTLVQPPLSEEQEDTGVVDQQHNENEIEAPVQEHQDGDVNHESPIVSNEISEKTEEPTNVVDEGRIATPPTGRPSSASAMKSAYNSVAAFLLNDDDIQSISYTLVLHGDNTFEYTWKQKRTGQRPMEHQVELTGRWHKPVLNRDRYGERDQRVFLETERAHFTRLANYDTSTNTWKQTLRTLTRNGEDWVPCGENDRGLPPLQMIFNVLDDNVLENIGDITPHDIITNGIPSRILSGLTKKAGMKLGTPLDVMTDKWLPCRKLCLEPSIEKKNVKPFNPLLWY